ncbi:MAG TPA: BACON domain-containing carbohydrate-binding protein [Pseudobacter sp.]|jgi:sugar lactone lactonase YvrE|nr:BACON domain-containing carbohydrate-binding protein [Pseudobacter sp.]
MKFLPLGLLALISSFCIYSCSKKGGDQPSPPQNQLSADKTSITLKVEGGNESFNISSNTDWELSGLPSWIRATPTKGSSGTTKVDLVYDANTSANELKTTITLRATGLDPVTVAVTQLQPEVTITSFTEHGKGGGQLVITGTGFSEVLAENIVKVNELQGTVTAASKTSLTVTIPAKAGDGKINVKTNTRTQTSTTDFYYDWVGVVSTFNYSPASYALPSDIVFDSKGNMFISDRQMAQIFKVGSDGVVRVFAGSGLPGMDDGAATVATFGSPQSMAIDANDNIFVVDYSNACIRKITPGGTVSRIAGHNTRFGTVDGDISVASFQNPEGIAVDKNGVIYVSEYYAAKIRKIEGNTVSTFAGSGVSGDQDGTGTAAQFNIPQGLRLDADGNILLAATYNNKIKKITPAGVVTTVAGSLDGFVDGASAQAKFWFPRGIGTDSKGNIAVADRGNFSIRYISKKGWVSTLGGINTDAGFVDGTGSASRFCLPENVNIAPNGDVWVVDGCEGKIRKIVLQ